MQFVSMRDFRTQTTQVWNRLQSGEEIVITNKGKPRAFLVNIPDGLFDIMLDGIRQAQKQAGSVVTQNEPAAKNETLHRAQTSPDEKKAAMQEIRDLLASLDGSSIDLDRMSAERRTVKYERPD